MKPLLLSLLLVATAMSVAGCQRRAAADTRIGLNFGGSAVRPVVASLRGVRVIEAFGCGSCHTVPGVPGADGRVAPPLNFFGRRTFIAGELPNTADNLVRWLRDPPSVEPGTAMPVLGLTEAQARDVATYLESLR